MSSRQHTLAASIHECKGLMVRYLAAFDDANRTMQARNLPNHVAWCLGHCALTMHRLAAHFDGGELPSGDFVQGDAGDEERFATERISFGSRPQDDPGQYPVFGRCVEIYDAACDRLAEAVHFADDAALERIVKWGAGENRLEALVIRMVFHNGTHCGQITDLRRALGLKSIFG